MTAVNPFVLEKDKYVRDLNLFKHYIEDQALYLSLMFDKPIDYCRDFVIKQLKPGGRFPFRDPKVVYAERVDQADRIEKEGTLNGFLSDTIKNEHLIAPNFSTYLPPKVEKSYLATFIDFNVAARGKAKKAMFAAEMAGDEILKQFKENEQKSRKIRNNSISGGHTTPSTPLVNKTSHSTLTSLCRSTSGFGNANNEKLLCGNRHYWNPKIALNNIISIVRNTDYDKLQRAMDTFGIRAPTVEETLHVVTVSSNKYCPSENATKTYRALIEKLTAIQRAAFVYTGDLYHVAKYNDEMMRKFISKLSAKVMEDCPDATKVLKSHREEYMNLAVLYFPDEMIAKSEELFPSNHPDPKIRNRSATMKDIVGHKLEEWIASTVKNIAAVVEEYRDFIEAIMVTANVPASLAFFPDSIRDAAVTSDTDSTIFTVQDWVFWMHGPDPGFNEKTDATGAAMVFLAAESITHVLARMSANFGIETSRIHQVAMKNEFMFPVFAVTPIGKHYYAMISAQEGNVFRKYKLEKKGVHLKSSNLPKEIVQQAEMMMRDILETVKRGEKLSLLKYLREVAATEREIERSILAGESTYMRNAQIKSADAYTKGEMNSPYMHYHMWQACFADKYGDAPKPPYACSKVAITMDSATDFKNWVANIQDKKIAARIEKFFKDNNKTTMTALLLPKQTLAVSGMPVEIAQIAAIRRSIYDITSIFYTVLESIGYYTSNDNLTNLCMDSY